MIRISLNDEIGISSWLEVKARESVLELDSDRTFRSSGLLIDGTQFVGVFPDWSKQIELLFLIVILLSLTAISERS